jgi:hypothetical protein
MWIPTFWKHLQPSSSGLKLKHCILLHTAVNTSWRCTKRWNRTSAVSLLSVIEYYLLTCIRMPHSDVLWTFLSWRSLYFSGSRLVTFCSCCHFSNNDPRWFPDLFCISLYPLVAVIILILLFTYVRFEASMVNKCAKISGDQLCQCWTKNQCFRDLIL